MANPTRTHITLACTECKERNYTTVKNKKTSKERMELNKYLAAGTELLWNKANKSWKFFQVGFFTKILGGNLNNSSCGLKAVVKR